MAEIRDIPADVKALRPGDWIAFPWSYNGGVSHGDSEDKEIMVAQLSGCYQDNKVFSVNFLHGYKSVGEDLLAEHVIAIGSQSGKESIKLFRGHYGFHILQPEHPVLVRHQKEYSNR